MQGTHGQRSGLSPRIPKYAENKENLLSRIGWRAAGEGIGGAVNDCDEAQREITILVFCEPCERTIRNSVAAFSGCSRMQPCEAARPSERTAVVPWMA